MTTPPKPISFTTEQVTKQKLSDLSNNVQWLVDNAMRVRYRAATITKDTGIKVMSGKSVFPAQSNNFGYLHIHFGNFFTAGSKPIVIATLESVGGANHRSKVVVQALTGSTGGVDHNGFVAIVSTEAHPRLKEASWINWIAIGW